MPELDAYFNYMVATLPFHALKAETVQQWRTLVRQYFVGSGKTPSAKAAASDAGPAEES